MPIFEYCCEKCGHAFEDLETVADRDRPRPCPACTSMKVRREVSSFAARVAGGSPGAKCDTGGST